MRRTFNRPTRLHLVVKDGVLCGQPEGPTFPLLTTVEVENVTCGHCKNTIATWQPRPCVRPGCATMLPAGSTRRVCKRCRQVEDYTNNGDRIRRYDLEHQRRERLNPAKVEARRKYDREWRRARHKARQRGGEPLFANDA